MDLFLYAIYDNDFKTYSNPGIGFDDKDYCKWLTSSLEKQFDLVPDEEKEQFLYQIRSSEIRKIGVFNTHTGSLTQESIDTLVSLKDFMLESEVSEKWNIEKEVQE